MTATEAVEQHLSEEFRNLFLRHIPLGRIGFPEEIAEELNMPLYAVARKSKKLYMQDGIEVSYGSSITTGQDQKLYLSKHDVDLIKGKKVGIVDDVISTGESLKGLEKLVELAGGIVHKKLFVLAEGDAKDRKDVIYLASIPLL